MDKKQLVQLVTAEVMRQLGQDFLAEPEETSRCRKQALAVFTGGAIGLEQSLAELQQIQALNFELTIVLSVAAEEVVGVKRVQESLGSETRIVTQHSPYPGKFLREAEIVLVPVLTQNTAAKLAYTLSDTLATTLIMQALMLGKPVLAARNAADPQDSWRLKDNSNECFPGLFKALQENLHRVEGYGIQLVQVGDLAVSCKKILDGRAKISMNFPQAKKDVLDAAAVKAAADNGLKIISTAPGTIVTPLAWDIARDQEIEIVRNGGL